MDGLKPAASVGPTAEGTFVEPAGAGRLRCLACAHRCELGEGDVGSCGVRAVQGGGLQVPFGYVGALAQDPVEKKPLYHFHPGASTLTFGMLGCDLKCSFCQNWFVSQVGRDPAAQAQGTPITAEKIVETAQERGARMVVSSFNEPWITAEWAEAVFRAARAAGMKTGFVSNGHTTPEAVARLAPLLDAVKVDLKAFQESTYKGLGGRLKPVKETLRALHGEGVWVEVVTVLIPEVNDGEDELRSMARFLARLDRDLPWHLHGFHPDYKMTNRRATSAADLDRARGIAAEAGLRYVYGALVPELPEGWEDTRCGGCEQVLVRRRRFRVLENRIDAGGGCPGCGELVPGVWGPVPSSGPREPRA